MISSWELFWPLLGALLAPTGGTRRAPHVSFLVCRFTATHASARCLTPLKHSPKRARLAHALERYLFRLRTLNSLSAPLLALISVAYTHTDRSLFRSYRCPVCGRTTRPILTPSAAAQKCIKLQDRCALSQVLLSVISSAGIVYNLVPRLSEASSLRRWRHWIASRWAGI